MDDILYLIHTTNKPDCLNWTELKTPKFNVDDQFPGIYLSIVTKNNIENDNFYAGKYVIFISKKILLQSNYHINEKDHNGIISEKNTFFSWNLQEFIKTQKTKCGKNTSPCFSEVVFHDDIDMKYCCGIIGLFQKNNSYMKINDFLPRCSLENSENPDMTKLPFVCYPFEDMYTGTTKIPKSSSHWFKIMAKVCNIKTNSFSSSSSSSMIAKFKEQAQTLHNDRGKQKLYLLKAFTTTKKMPTHKKSQSFNKTHKKKTKRWFSF